MNWDSDVVHVTSHEYFRTKASSKNFFFQMLQLHLSNEIPSKYFALMWSLMVMLLASYLLYCNTKIDILDFSVPPNIRSFPSQASPRNQASKSLQKKLYSEFTLWDIFVNQFCSNQFSLLLFWKLIICWWQSRINVSIYI